jgi:hypothetical protein
MREEAFMRLCDLVKDLFGLDSRMDAALWVYFAWYHISMFLNSLAASSLLVIALPAYLLVYWRQPTKEEEAGTP